jgi:hypothetical protein
MPGNTHLDTRADSAFMVGWAAERSYMVNGDGIYVSRNVYSYNYKENKRLNLNLLPIE